MIPAKRLPDGKLLVPRRAESEGVVGDALVEIGPEDPSYQPWLACVEDTESENRQIVLTALIQARADGDDASAAELERLLEDPARAAEYVQQITAPTT